MNTKTSLPPHSRIAEPSRSAEHLFRYAEILRGVPDDESIRALEERNEARRQAAIAELGHRWLGFTHRKEELQ